MNQTVKLTISGACVALGVVLPIAFHSIPNAGSIFLPMHIPVLLCGLLCGPLYGLLCGILAPLISSFVTGMPPMAILPGMTAELAVYGLISGLLIQKLPVKKPLASIYLSLIAAMVSGRIVSGLLNGLIFRRPVLASGLGYRFFHYRAAGDRHPADSHTGHGRRTAESRILFYETSDSIKNAMTAGAGLPVWPVVMALYFSVLDPEPVILFPAVQAKLLSVLKPHHVFRGGLFAAVTGTGPEQPGPFRNMADSLFHVK